MCAGCLRSHTGRGTRLGISRQDDNTNVGEVMSDLEMDVLGPIDYLVVEFPADRANFSGEMASELTSPVDRGLVRVLDLVFIKKDAEVDVE
jgi:hypothetical protein